MEDIQGEMNKWVHKTNDQQPDPLDIPHLEEMQYQCEQPQGRQRGQSHDVDPGFNTNLADGKAASEGDNTPK